MDRMFALVINKNKVNHIEQERFNTWYCKHAQATKPSRPVWRYQENVKCPFRRRDI